MQNQEEVIKNSIEEDYLKTLNSDKQILDDSSNLLDIYSKHEKVPALPQGYTKKKTRTLVNLDMMSDYSEKLTALKSNNITTKIKLEQRAINFPKEALTNIDNDQFDIFNLEKDIGKDLTLLTMSAYVFFKFGCFNIVHYQAFDPFIRKITEGYLRSNSYHTDLHAADVLHSCYLMMLHGNAAEKLKLTPVDLASFFLAAIIHDFKHPGLTNGYMVNTKADVAITYNG